VGLAVVGASAVGTATSGTKLATVAVEVVGSMIVDRADQAWEERLFGGSVESDAGVKVGALERSSTGPAIAPEGRARFTQVGGLAFLPFGATTSFTGLPLFSGGEAEAEAWRRRPRLPLFLRREPIRGPGRELELPLFVAGLPSM